MRRFSLFAVTALLAASCGGSSPGTSSGSGGTSSSSGGTTGSGGSASGSGGTASSSGGATSSGGKTGSGGTSSSSGGSTGSGGTVGSGGSASGGSSSSSGGTTGSGGMPSSSGGSAVPGGANGSGGMKAAGGAPGSGGAASGGAGGQSNGGGGAGVPPASGFTCNTVLGIDSTNEWFSGGFENEVPNAKWQIIYHHPGYISDWADTSDAVWSQAASSACSMNSDNPERVIFNAFADPSDSSYQAAAGWVSGMVKVVENLKKKYSHLKRVDLLTVTRGPNNMVCSGDSQMFSMIPAYVDSAMSMVAAMYPGLVTVAPPFYAPSCDDFDSSMKPPHLSTTGKPIIAKLYGDYYSMEP